MLFCSDFFPLLVPVTVTDDSRSLLLPLHIFVITSHLLLGQVLALLRHNLLKLDGRILLLGPL